MKKETIPMRETKTMPGNEKERLTVTDQRTGKSYDLPLAHGNVNAIDLRQIKDGPDDFGVMAYDPAFKNTASCVSRVTFIDGDQGILEYRGYPIQDLAERSTFLEVAYLLLFGKLPTQAELTSWTQEIALHTLVHENIKKFIDGFQHNAHPMGMVVSAVAALSTFYPESKNVLDPANRHLQMIRLLGKMPTLAAYAYRHSMGWHYVHPDNELAYPANFLNMMFRMTERIYEPNPVLVKALDVLFILHADHEQNCSANAMRSVGSSQADPYVSTAAAAAALYGPLHGGANEAVLRMLQKIEEVKNVPEFVKRVKAGEGLLMGFGHRVYKNYDPRAKIIKLMADRVFDVTGRNRLLDIALELERIALEDDYFVKRKLYPNVDFYSGLIYQALRIPTDMFPVMFAIPRTAGWLAQWDEMLTDPEQKIARPRQVYLGKRNQTYVPIDRR
jgi:citrate synthase